MPKKKATKKVVTKSVATSAKKNMIVRNQFFGLLLIALAAGALIVFVRYIVITVAAPADIYLIEPAQLIPGMTK